MKIEIRLDKTHAARTALFIERQMLFTELKLCDIFRKILIIESGFEGSLENAAATQPIKNLHPKTV